MSDTKLIMEQLNKMDERLDSIDKTLIENTKDLKYHIKRTDLLEATVAPAVATDLFVRSVVKLIMALGAVVTFMIGVYVAVVK